MQNIARMLADITHKSSQERNKEEPSYAFLGGSIGFVCYWLAVGLPLWVYGPNTLFFLIYTWPFFLALMPVAVLSGMVLSAVFHGQFCKIVPSTAIWVVGLFWLVFSFLSGW
jgi:fatty acid desaturase